MIINKLHDILDDETRKLTANELKQIVFQLNVKILNEETDHA